MDAFDVNLEKNRANFQSLSPLSFLERCARAYPGHPAVIHGKQSLSYADFYNRCRKLASVLSRMGIGEKDTVSVMLSNTPPMLECHYGVPMIGAVLHSINTRLDAANIAFQLDHAETKVVIVDREFSKTMKEVLAQCNVEPYVIDYDDPEFDVEGERIGSIEYEEFIKPGDETFSWQLPQDEWNSISLNYTSGTTGNPKGVVYHHRGAYLMGYSNMVAGEMPKHATYLWTLPMFHCNGWCFPWTVSVVGGTHVCLRWVRAQAIFDAIAEHNVTHMCGAPIVMATLINAPESEKRPLPSRVKFITAAAPPPESVLAQMADAGFDVTHVYGLTETYGPAVVNEWNRDWDGLSADDKAQKQARQGIRYAALEDLTVLDPETMSVVPADGETLGEVMFRGNIVMKGYLKNEQETSNSFSGGWFHSGDLGVIHPDGYIQLKDRSKDIIISGGENISSIEVEDTIYKHPQVMAVAVVAKPDDKWGEVPIAYVELKSDASLQAEDIIEFCRENLARYKCPRYVEFTELPKTSTGKIQKYILRDKAKSG